MLLALQIVLLVIGALWFWTGIGGLRAVFRLPEPLLMDAIEAGELDGLTVSVIVAARDEVGRIEETVRRALAQEGVKVEVIAVDDRSTDGTGESLDAMAQEDNRLRVVHITDLPDGWLGKCHALHRGSQIASGDWLLFLDADTHLSPDAVAGSLAQGRRLGADHITLLPNLLRPSFWGQVAMSSFWVQMSDRSLKINNDHKRLFMGVGAFNMIRRETYDSIGGHERLRLQVIDDMVLGLCVRKIGARTRVLMGCDAAEVEYGRDLPDAIQLFEKNGFAAVNFSTPLVVALGLLFPLVVLGALLGPALALALGAWGGWVAFGAILFSALPAVVMAQRQRWSAFSAALSPIGHMFFLYAILRSAILAWKRGGIVWRETFYSLREIRAARLSWRVRVPLPELISDA